MKIRWSSLLAMLAIVAAMMGCGGGSDDGAPTVDVTGTWVAKLSDGSNIKLPVQQSGSSLQGSFDRGTIAGSVSGNQVSFSLIFTDGTTASGSGTVTGNTMSGSWQYSDGSQGTFNASRS